MKTLVEIQKVKNEGLIGLMGESIMVWCMSYIYHGKLIGVNDYEIKLTNANVVYETGPLCEEIRDEQKLPDDVYIRTSAIECYYKK